MKLLDTLKNHKGTIAALSAVFGAFATAYYAHKDTIGELQEDDYTRGMYSCPECPLVDKVKYYGKHYWRTGVALGFTVGNIVISDRSHVKTIAGLAGGVALYVQENEEIKEAVKEVFGQDGVEKLDKAIIQKHADKMGEHESGKKVKGDSEKFRIYDETSGLYLWTDKEQLLKAEIEANYELQGKWIVPYWYVLSLLGKPEDKKKKPNPEICYLGWALENEFQCECWKYTKDQTPWIRFKHEWDENRKCMVLYYEVRPEICYDDNGPLEGLE